jgi:hypothetical protein
MSEEQKKKPAAKSEGQVEMIAKSEVEALFKAEREKMAEAIKKAEERAAASEAVVKAEKDLRIQGEWLAKCEKHLRFAPGKSVAEHATMLKSLEEKDPEAAKAVFESLKATSAAIEKSAALRDAGVVGSGSGDSALAKIQKSAADKLGAVKGEDKFVEGSMKVAMRKAQAFREALLENKSEYREYLDEQKAN